MEYLGKLNAQDEATAREDKRYDLQLARLDAQDKESARRFDAQMQTHSEDFNKTFGLQQAQEDRAQKKQQLDLDEHNKLVSEKEAYRSALLDPVIARTPLQVAREDTQAAISPIAGEMEKNLVGMTPEERKVATEGAINPLVGTALKAMTTEDYSASEHDRLFDAYKSKGVPAEKIEELVTQQLGRGILNDTNLRSRADITASSLARKADAKEALRAEVELAKLANGSKLSVGEDGALSVNTGKGAFAVGGKPMDALNAGKEYQNMYKGSNWVRSDPNVRDFATMLSPATESLTKNGVSQREIDRAVTPDVLSKFVATGGNDAGKLADLMTTQIELNHRGLGSEVGKDRARLMAANNTYKELLSAEKAPSYTGTLSALRDASEPSGLVANAEAMNGVGLARGLLPQPTANTHAQTELKAEVSDTDPAAYQALQNYVNDPSKGPSREALLQAVAIAKDNGVSDSNIDYMVKRGSVYDLLDRSASKGTRMMTRPFYTAGQAIGNTGTLGLGILKSAGVGLYGSLAPIFTDASIEQAAEEANKYLGFDETRRDLISGDKALADLYTSRKDLLSHYGVNLSAPQK
jgi:hypothetical protein